MSRGGSPPGSLLAVLVSGVGLWLELETDPLGDRALARPAGSWPVGFGGLWLPVLAGPLDYLQDHEGLELEPWLRALPQGDLSPGRELLHPVWWPLLQSLRVGE